MQIQIRDSRDPFSQALAFLFKTAKDPLELKRKMRTDMIPLVTQVAIKIGGIDTEQSLRDRALPVFTGIISLHLANTVHGKECNVIEEWIREIAAHDLAMLFRKGYTLLDELVKNTRVGNSDSLLSVQTFAERMQEYATHTENGVWAGFNLYREQVNSYISQRTLREFAEWLCKKAGTPIRTPNINSDGPMDIPETIVPRILFNVLHSGKISTDLNFKKIRDIVDMARTDKKWWKRVEKHYSVFVGSLPEKFRRALDDKGETARTVSQTVRKAKSLTDKRTSRYNNIDDVCFMTGLDAPGLSKEMRKMFPA